ncbi:MAG: ATP-binding cassette domain-containing protein [Planctomycetota bacterium]|nr:ATP-binding cassette domain-containing protein [Planctomycetota bacterium]
MTTVPAANQNQPGTLGAGPAAALAEAPPILQVDGLRVSFPVRSGLLHRTTSHHHAVDGISLQMARGETLGLVGESGCGKTTAGRAILRLIPETVAHVSGTVAFDGQDVLQARRSTLLRLRRRMQIVFQDPAGSLNPRMRVADIVSEPLRVHRLARGRDEAREMAAQTLEHCGMPRAALDRYPHEFSGGQRQRIAIARALSLKPDLVVLDEPTSALDVSIQATILNLLTDLQRELGLAYLFVSHDMGVIGHVCDRVAVMNSGQIVEQGSRDQVLLEPRHEYTKSLLRAVPRVRRA